MRKAEAAKRESERAAREAAAARHGRRRAIVYRFLALALRSHDISQRDFIGAKLLRPLFRQALIW